MALSTTTRKSLFGINALSAWIGLGMTTFIELFGLVETKFTGESTPTSQFGHEGDYASGLAGAQSDFLTCLATSQFGARL
jgi:hypothetical protein